MLYLDFLSISIQFSFPLMNTNGRKASKFHLFACCKLVKFSDDLIISQITS